MRRRIWLITFYTLDNEQTTRAAVWAGTPEEALGHFRDQARLYGNISVTKVECSNITSIIGTER